MSGENNAAAQSAAVENKPEPADAEVEPEPPTTVEEMSTHNSLVDPRFQNAQASRYCYTHYVDYHRCQYLLGEDDASCDIFKSMYQRMCPNAWIASWDAKREKGIFPRNCATELD